MDYRKIQLTGESTYIVSLPKKWVTKNNLNKGDTLSLIETGDEIILRAKEEKETETEIELGKKNLDLITRTLITKYIQGYDTVTIKSNSYIPPEIRRGLKDISSLLIGMEEFGETSNEITFRMLMKEKGNVEDTVLRMHRMSLSSLEELLKNIGPGEYNENILKDIVRRDSDVDKFYFLVLRQLSSLGSYDAIMWIQVAKSIERISDHIENIASHMLAGGKVKEEHMKEHEKLIEMYSDVRLALVNRSAKKADEILGQVKNFRIRETQMMNGLKSTNPDTLLIYGSFRRVGEYISDIAEVVINMS
jgi:phosphate uptake regulator